MNFYLIIIGLLLFATLAALRREWAIYLIILLLPSYQIRFPLFGIPMTFLEAMILILAISTLLPLSASGGRERIEVRGKLLNIADLFIFLFLFAAFVSVFVSPVTLKAAGIFKAYFFEGVLFYFLVRKIIDTPQKLQGVFKSLALLVLYLSGFGIYQFLTLSNLPFYWWAVDVASRRITSLLNHPNALALLLGPILAMLIIRQPSFLPLRQEAGTPSPRLSLLRGRGIKGEGVFYWAAIILGIIALYLTFSRAAWLALIITIAIFTLLSRRPSFSPPSPPEAEGDEEGMRGERSKSKRVLAYGLLIIVIVFSIPFSRLKLLELANPSDPSQQNRYVLWSAAADMLKKSPIFGVGLMGFHEAYKNYPLGPDRVVQNYPHNFFLNFWVETGLLGLLAVLGLLYLFFKKIWTLTLLSPGDGERVGERSKKTYALAAAAGMTMILLHGLVDVSYFKNDLSVLFWLIYALPNLNFLTE